MNKEEYINKLDNALKLISESEIEKAIDVIFNLVIDDEIKNLLIVLTRDNSSIQKEKILGTMSFEEISRKENGIAYRLLDVIKKVKNSVGTFYDRYVNYGTIINDSITILKIQRVDRSHHHRFTPVTTLYINDKEISTFHNGQVDEIRIEPSDYKIRVYSYNTTSTRGYDTHWKYENEKTISISKVGGKILFGLAHYPTFLFFGYLDYYLEYSPNSK